MTKNKLKIRYLNNLLVSSFGLIFFIGSSSIKLQEYPNVDYDLNSSNNSQYINYYYFTRALYFKNTFFRNFLKKYELYLPCVNYIYPIYNYFQLISLAKYNFLKFNKLSTTLKNLGIFTKNIYLSHNRLHLLLVYNINNLHSYYCKFMFDFLNLLKIFFFIRLLFFQKTYFLIFFLFENIMSPYRLT
jgi:hypothetical protein